MLEAQMPGLRDCEWQWEEACQRQKDLVEKVVLVVVSTQTTWTLLTVAGFPVREAGAAIRHTESSLSSSAE